MSIINIIFRLKFSFGCNSVTSRLQCICVHCTVYKARSKDGSDYWEKYPGQAGCKKCPDQDEVTIVRLLSNDQCPIVHPAISGHTSDLTSMDDTRIDEKLKNCNSIAFLIVSSVSVLVSLIHSALSEWRDPPQSKWSKHAAMFSFSSSAVRDTSDQCRSILVSDWPKLQIDVARSHIRFRLTRARLSFLHIRSQLRSLTVGDQAYSESNVPEKTPLRLSPRKTG